MPKMTFKQWKRAVDAECAAQLGGLTTDDLPDCSYYDWWSDGVTPKSAVKRAIKYAKDS